mgnify:CR=1 FL=1
MDLGDFVDYCSIKPGVSDSFPFDEHVLVFKVMNKMFALANANEFQSINLKCDPERAIELRDRYPETVLPGYHMSKIHWNTVMVNKELKDTEVYTLIDHSYDLIVQSLSKKLKEDLSKLSG